MSKVTMKDIAKKAGVSQPLVSLIMNNNRTLKISEKSREKVLRIAEELNYTPDAAAISLKTGKKNVIGIISSREVPITAVFASPYFAEIYAGVGEVVTAGGYRMLFQQQSMTDDPLALGRANLVDGLVFILLSEFREEFEREHMEVVKSLGIPFTVVHSFADISGCTSVGVDYEKGAYLATKHLIDHGYTDIGVVYNEKQGMLHKQNLAGCRRAMSGAGLSLPEKRVYHCNGIYVEQGMELAADFMKKPDDLPRALYCENSAMANGIVYGLRQAGIDVPGQVAVTATGDVVSPGAIVNDLTLYRHPAKEKGAEAAKMLLEMIDNPNKIMSSETKVMEMPFIKGETCGC